MYLKRKVNQHRRDFTGVYACEHCRHEQVSRGYDDQYFHQNVIPRMECAECGGTADSDAPVSSPDIAPWAVL